MHARFQFATCEMLVSTVVDLFPEQMQGKKRTLVTLAVSLLLFILGLPFITRVGCICQAGLVFVKDLAVLNFFLET